MSGVVDLVAILAAPVFGLAGVWIGGIIQGKREDKRLEFEQGRAERQLMHEVATTQDQRLFDHRRLAYAGFIDMYLDVYHQVFEWHFGDRDDADFNRLFDLMWKASVGVSLYGSPEANRLAGDIVAGLSEFGDAPGLQQASEANEAVSSKYGKFLDEARRDLRSAERPSFA